MLEPLDMFYLHFYQGMYHKRHIPIHHELLVEDIYIKEYSSVPALAAGLEDYFQLYNYERLNQSLGYRTPADVHFAVNVPIL